jgi:DNA invertase Pin-like site-specific DNA recombinase
VHGPGRRGRSEPSSEFTAPPTWSRSALGPSAATTAGRTGFQRLVAEVRLRRAGAVVSREVSRLARNNRDWHQLLELCWLTDTVILDADGVYDPRLLNDRLLLGLKGTSSEAELGWLR